MPITRYSGVNSIAKAGHQGTTAMDAPAPQKGTNPAMRNSQPANNTTRMDPRVAEAMSEAKSAAETTDLQTPISPGESVQLVLTKEPGDGALGGYFPTFSLYSGSCGEWYMCARVRKKTTKAQIIISRDPQDTSQNCESLLAKVKATENPGEYSVWSDGVDPKNCKVHPRSLERVVREQLAFVRLQDNNRNVSILVPEALEKQGKQVRAAVKPIEVDDPQMQSGQHEYQVCELKDGNMSSRPMKMLTEGPDGAKVELEEKSEGEYHLTLSHPLSITQGFGIALSVLHAVHQGKK